MPYIIRLDDACEKRDIAKWDRMESILDQFEIKPLVGVIPHCEDPKMEGYPVDDHFWGRVAEWQEKKWTIALHGYNHVYLSHSGGINPVNNRSEFAGIELEQQRKKIRDGIHILQNHRISAHVFFAPAHTFDENTITALKECSQIRIISDTVANDAYCRAGFTYVPQQSGRVRVLPFKLVTFCYHPNVMTEHDFEILKAFLEKNKHKFICFPLYESKRRQTILDQLLQKLYLVMSKIRGC